MLGYYAHSHGSGHCNYANIFSKIFGSALTIFTDRGHAFDNPEQVVMLENENPDGTEFERDDFPEPRALHYAPVNIKKITQRNLIILDSILQKKISMLIIDVSVEIAMLARVSSIPYVYVRLQGDRDDIPHLNAYEGASFLLAYYPKEMEALDTPAWIIDKTIYLGFLSKFMFGGNISEQPKEYRERLRPILLYLTGFGGSLVPDFEGICKDYNMFAIGPSWIRNKAFGFEHIGVVKDTKPYIEHADAIIAACGANTTSEILSLEKKFIAMPEIRHYNEQQRMAEYLNRNGWAIDLSQHHNVASALDAINFPKKHNLPNISVNELKTFKAQLEFFGYRADRFMDNLKDIHNSRTVTKGSMENFNSYLSINL
ncbi:MAG: glycosyltransferase [Pricia sp.]